MLHYKKRKSTAQTRRCKVRQNTAFKPWDICRSQAEIFIRMVGTQ
ncbi:hypothetical protein [Sporofaciens musculi]|nr:hypothetical protein [Sporofaciens musculi]